MMFERLYAASHRPPKLGDHGGINFQVMNSLAKKLNNSSLGKSSNFWDCFYSDDAPLKLVALSDVMV